MGIMLVGPDKKKEASGATIAAALETSQCGFETDGYKRMLFKSPTNGNVYFVPQNVSGIATAGIMVNSALGAMSVSALTDLLKSSTQIGVGNYSIGFNTPVAPGGAENIAVGTACLQNLDTGSLNIAIGYQVLPANITGSSNIGIGSLALNACTASQNIAIGTGALEVAVTDHDSVAIGFDALAASNATDGLNTAIGSQSLLWLSSGHDCIAIGYLCAAYQSGGVSHLTNVSNSVYIGNNIKCQEGETNAIVIGDSTTSFGTNCVRIGNAATSKVVLGDACVLQLGVGTGPLLTSGGGIHISGHTLRIDTIHTPATSGESGYIGEICWDTNYIYVCTDTSTWKRAALNTF